MTTPTISNGEFKALPNSEQVSDDFMIGFHAASGTYVALRAPGEECAFEIYSKNKDSLIAEAVYIFHKYLEAKDHLDQRTLPLWDTDTQKVLWQ